jgi:RNA polymerase sigma factor (sigma-70 family)
MATALTKPKVKSRIAEKLTRQKSKTTPRKRKAARAVPVAKADRKKVSGRKQQKASGKAVQKITGRLISKTGKSKATKPVKVNHTAVKLVKKHIEKKGIIRKGIKLLHTKAKHKPHFHPTKNQNKTVMTELSETIQIQNEAATTEAVQISPNLSDKALHDYKLVRSAIDTGDQKAFAELMSRYKDSIYFMLLKMVNNRDDAEDLTIEAFGKAFKNIRQYTPDYAFSTWLFKIATNNCIDFIRKKRKQAFSIDRGFENEEGQEMVLEVKSLQPDPEEHYMKKQKVEMMRDVVDKLKPRYKKLVELRYFQELAYEEIALELNLPLGTVKAQLFRAREFLYQIMKNSSHQI